ncbi:MAG: zinc ribbon domain-containing protein [Christensenellales bacterium]|jgi:hypothetical protein
MAKDLFGGLGQLMKGLSGFMPQDDPDVKLLNLQSEISDLESQENELFAQIGRQAFEADPSAWPQAEKLRLIQNNIASAREELAALNEECKARKEAQAAAEAETRCPNCDCQNPQGTKFCQECGTKLGGAQKSHCAGCGAALAPGARFCGECGMKQEG